MPPIEHVPFYLDWTFWTAVIAVAALILSQLPPVHLLLRPRRLGVEVNNRLSVHHKVGNPNATLQLNISNTGGRTLRIKAITLSISRDGKPLVDLPAQSYFEKFSDPSAAVFVPFSIQPEANWSHTVNFLNFFDRPTEKAYRTNSSALRADIVAKRVALAPGSTQDVKGDQTLVDPFIQLFGRLFVWEPGEYVAELRIQVEPSSASYSKRYRFTIYESDTADLRKWTEDYVFGAGILYDSKTHTALFIPLSEEKA